MWDPWRSCISATYLGSDPYEPLGNGWVNDIPSQLFAGTLLDTIACRLH